MMLCPCGSQKAHTQCCGRYLSGKQVAKTAEQLMRSRFCAFYLGGHGQYLLQTWHPTTRPPFSSLELDQRDTDWQSLEIVEKSQQGNQGIVEFKAFYNSDDGLECWYERSRFERLSGIWYYLDGQFK
jgi:SEC-C motif-containing protein